MQLPKLSPAFADLNEHFFRSGITAIGEMQHALVIKGVREVAAYRLGFDTSRLYVVTVMLGEDEEAAARVEAETRAVPQASGVIRNGPFVMACTFQPSNQILEGRVAAAFMAYQPGLRTTT